MSKINKIKLSGTSYDIEDASLKGDIYVTSENRNSVQSVIKEGVYSLSTDDIFSISGSKANSTDRIIGLIIVDGTSYNFTGSTSSDVEGVSALDGIVSFDLSSAFTISLVDRDTNKIDELFIESFTTNGDESPMSNVTITHNPSIGVNKIDYVATLYTEFVHEKYALVKDLETKQDTLVSGTNIKTINNQSILGSGNITIQGGGSGATVIEATQAEYDAASSAGTLDLTALYIITDATPIDINNYYTSAQTDSAINAATSGLQETLVSGTNIKTINNESILGSGNITIQGGGGGTTYSAGTNIDITNDTISCTLPISVVGNSNYKGFSLSDANNYVDTQCRYVTVLGVGNKAWNRTKGEFACGGYNIVQNDYELSCGYYSDTHHVISSNFGDSGNTLFTVGNGTSDNARHNAFEIRQNGDIYITSGGTDIKLQDNLGGGGTTYSAGTDIDITNDVISVKQISGDSAFVDVTSTLENEASVAINTSAIIATMKEDVVANGVSFYDNNGRFLTVENNGSGLDVLGNTSYFNYSTDGYTITASTLASGDTFINISNDSGNKLDSLVEYFVILATTYSLQDFADNVYGKFSGYVATSAITSSVTSGDTNAVSSDAVYTAMGGLKLQQITQADYDALVSGGTVDASTLYIITNVVN